MVKNGLIVMKLGLGALFDLANILGMSKISLEASITPLDIRVGCLLPQNRSKLAMLVVDEIINPPMWLKVNLDMYSKC